MITIKSNEKTQSVIVSLASLLFIYSSVILHSILYFLNKGNESGQLKWMYIVATVLSASIFVFQNRYRISKNMVKCCIGIFVILFLFYFTGLKYVTNNTTYHSEWLLLLAITPCTILLPTILSNNENRGINLMCVFICDLIVTMVIFVATFSSDSSTSAGLVSNESGLIYQNISYFSAFMFGLSVYLLQEEKYCGAGIPHRFILCLAAIQGLVCVASGGRGGFVLFGILLVYMVVTVMQNKRRILTILIFAIVVATILLHFLPIVADKYGFAGIDRIYNMFETGFGTDMIRAELRRNAVKHFIDKPIFGNGLGSVFYLLGEYSHNSFTDLLCETGMIGLFVFLIVIYKYFRLVKRNFHYSSLSRFMFMVFICGFTLNLFSGYLIVNNYVILPIVYELASARVSSDKGKCRL